MIKDIYNRKWIIENAISELQNYEQGILTIRGLHYRLVSRGMTNTQRHYKRVVSAMIKARWEGLIPFETFSDHDREMIGETRANETILEDKISQAQRQVKLWMNNYSKNRWENQNNYIEVFIEKKALQGVFQSVCLRHSVGLGACKGYPSLTFLNDASKRFKYMANKGKNPIILYFGDYDPSGEDIPRSIAQNMYDFGVYDIDVKRIALMEHQVVEMELPPAPIKDGDSRSKNWNGLGQVELDAVEPKIIQKMCNDAIVSLFDNGMHDELRDQEDIEEIEYKQQLRDYVNNELI